MEEGVAAGQPSENMASGPLVQPVEWRLVRLSWEHKRILSITQHPILLFLSSFPLRPHCFELEQMEKATIKGTKPTLPQFYCHAGGEGSSPHPHNFKRHLFGLGDWGEARGHSSRKEGFPNSRFRGFIVKPGSKLKSEDSSQ